MSPLDEANLPGVIHRQRAGADARYRVPFLTTLPEDGAHSEPKQEFDEALRVFRKDGKTFEAAIKNMPAANKDAAANVLRAVTENSAPTAESSRDLLTEAEHVFKLLGRVLDVCEKELDARDHDQWNTREITCRIGDLLESSHAVFGFGGRLADAGA